MGVGEQVVMRKIQHIITDYLFQGIIKGIIKLTFLCNMELKFSQICFSTFLSSTLFCLYFTNIESNTVTIRITD